VLEATENNKEDERSVNSEISEDQALVKKPKRNTLKGLLFGFGAATCYGLLICAVKLLFKISTLTVFEILYLRSLIAMIMVFIVLY